MFMVVRIRAFGLQAVLRLEAGEGGAACLVEEGAGQRQMSVVTALNTGAERSGVRLGMVATQAVARCPEIRIRARSVEAEATAQRALMCVMQGVSPLCEATAPGVWTLDVSGVMDLDAEALGRDVAEAVREVGLVARVGLAEDVALADLAARCADASQPVYVVDERDRFLAKVPLALAVDDEVLLSALQRWGLRSLGQFAALPVEAVTDRLGDAGRKLWERVQGRQSRLLQVLKAAPVYAERIELEYGVDTVEPLLFILKRFLDTLCAQLALAHQVAASMHVVLETEGDTVWERSFRLPEPSCRADLLLGVLETGLEAAETKYAVNRVALHLEPIDPQARQRALFEATVQNPWRFAETVDRLSGLLGTDRVGSPRLIDSHQPDAWSLVPLAVQVPALEPDAFTDVEQRRMGLPLQRMRPGVVAQVRTRGGYPVAVRSGWVSGTVIESRGPWRLSSAWWERRLQWEHEEWDVHIQGAGLYRLARRVAGWSLEGVYG